MDNESIELFSDDGQQVQLPGETESSEENILDKSRTSNEINNAISGEVVKQILISEEVGIIVPNYLIDLSKAETLAPIQIQALNSLIHPDGDVAIYLYTGKDTVKLGMGLSMILDKLILVAITRVFGEKCTVYRNYENGVNNRKMDSSMIGHLRLSI